MFDPVYLINDRTLNNIVKLEVDKALLENAEISSNIRTKLADQSKSLNIFHFAHILDLPITIKDAERLVEGYKLPEADDRYQMLTNFRNVMEFNRSNMADSYADMSVQLLLHLNKIMLTGAKEMWDVRLRNPREEVEGQDNWQQFVNPNVDDPQIEILNLVDWYRATSSRVHPILRIGIVIYRLLEIAPFASGNKFTILALLDFLTFRQGYLNKSFMPIIKNMDVSAELYNESWEALSRSNDYSHWLEVFTRELAKDFGETKLEVTRANNEQQEKNTQQPFLNLNKRQLKILRYLQSIPTVKREDYCQMMEVSTMTAFRDLNELVEKKLIRIDGKGRGTKYMLGHR